AVSRFESFESFERQGLRVSFGTGRASAPCLGRPAAAMVPCRVGEGGARMAARFGTGTAAICGLLLGALVLAPGCRPSREDRVAAGATAASSAEWEWLQKARQRLDGERERLARLEAASPAAPPSPETARLRKEVADLSAELNRRLVGFINANASESLGEPPSERQRAAIRMKSDEDALLARQYIEQAGDYRRAIEIYETALAADPDNERLHKALEA